jgi:uncharacterized protein YqgC (DUF456 family)
MDRWLDISIVGLTQLVMLVGLFGLIVPVFPGTVVIWGAALIYGFTTGYTTLGIVIMVLITILMLTSSLADNVLMGVGARKKGASWLTIGFALVAGIAGTIIFPPFGGFIAAPLTVLLLEYLRVRDLKKAWQALVGMAKGLGISFVVRFGIGMVMIALWWGWVWKG